MAQVFEIAVALGGPTEAESQQRVRALVGLYRQGIVPQAIITGAAWAFGTTETSQEGPSMGQRLADYAVDECGMPAEVVTVANGGGETIGEALAVKHCIRQMGLTRLVLVTTDTHSPRATADFRHVFGPSYEIQPHDSGSFPERRLQAPYEYAGRLLSRRVLRGTEPGDDEAIRERLFALVPGYTGASKRQIATNHVKDLLHLPLRAYEPVVGLQSAA